MIKIYRKEGWILNPNDDVVNKAIEKHSQSKKECPVYGKEETCCPCSDYIERDKCKCGLYLKVNK